VFCWPGPEGTGVGGCECGILRLSGRLGEHVWPPVMEHQGRGGVPELEG
jgi:hypothetical protein